MAEIVVRGCIIEVSDPEFARELEQAEREQLQVEWENNNLME